MLSLKEALKIAKLESESIAKSLKRMDDLIERYTAELSGLRKTNETIYEKQAQNDKILDNLTIDDLKVICKYEAKSAEYFDLKSGAMRTEDMYIVEPEEVTTKAGTRDINPKKVKLKQDYEKMQIQAAQARTTLDELKLKLSDKAKLATAGIDEFCQFQSDFISCNSMLAGLIDFRATIKKKKNELDVLIIAKGG